MSCKVNLIKHYRVETAKNVKAKIKTNNTDSFVIFLPNTDVDTPTHRWENPDTERKIVLCTTIFNTKYCIYSIKFLNK